jgi:mannose-6-phosphate isomerase-like protein (cupin superfamily)
MNRNLLAALAALPLAAVASAALAQAAPPAATNPPPTVPWNDPFSRSGPGGMASEPPIGSPVETHPWPGLPELAVGAIRPREHPSNQAAGVNIDQFLGRPTEAFAKVFHGLLTRSMLRAGDPYKVGPHGAVLEYRDDLSQAILEPRFVTSVIERPQVFFYYVDGGKGRLDSGPGTPYYDLHDGVGILIAPNAKHRFVNTGDTQLSMVQLSWINNEGATVRQPIKVVDTTQVPLNTNRAHWIHAGKSMFSPADGINVTISPILHPALTYGGPHAHLRGVEEIWVKVGASKGYAMLGSEIRVIDGMGAFLAPPNGLTPHSSLNIDERHPQTWLYISRRPATAPAPAANAAPQLGVVAPTMPERATGR